MIVGMVDGLVVKLKVNLKNVEGWIMLMCSYLILGCGNDVLVVYWLVVVVNLGVKVNLDDVVKMLGMK